MLRRKVSNAVCAFLVGLTLSLGACVPASLGPNGEIIQAEPDYAQLRLISTASIAAWAAAQKDGISKEDAQALMVIMDGMIDMKKEGMVINAVALAPLIKQEIPKRYQALAMVLIEITGRELDKWGVNFDAPTQDVRVYKIINAIYEGAKMGLTPYLLSEEYQHQMELYRAYHRA